jgi:cytochrome c-type biogenesis protein CcmH/NrfG
MRRAIRVRPDRADAWVRLGEILLAGGKTPAAIEAFRRALTLEPANPAAAEGLAAAGAGGAR